MNRTFVLTSGSYSSYTIIAFLEAPSNYKNKTLTSLTKEFFNLHGVELESHNIVFKKEKQINDAISKKLKKTVWYWQDEFVDWLIKEKDFIKSKNIVEAFLG